MKIFKVDAFTEKAFAGNPAAVCLLDRPRDAAWMQAVAAEMNLSETAFLVKRKDDGYDLRWFTPAIEVDLCGHATLACAHILFETKTEVEDTIVFQTKSGRLSATANGSWIELNFPVMPLTPTAAPEGLIEALGVRPVFVGKSMDYLVEVKSEDTVKSCTPDMAKLSKIKTRGIIITSKSADPKFDFVSRFFAPAAGINEDPLTGSAHCTLTPYWKEKLVKNNMTARQVSTRGGILKVRIENNRVFIAGQSVTVMNGDLKV